MWKDGAHSNDFKFFDKLINEQFTIGGTGINVYKYSGIPDASSADGVNDDPLAIQDFIFLENRDRVYDTDVYSMRGIYNVADTDFDLSQFGLFLQNDTLFITFHLADMDRILGRRLMSGDVLELPHLKDYNSLDTDLGIALKRYYVVQEGTKPTEGYSPTWFPHLWRVKCTPLVDSQEYKDILDKIQVDESTGEETDTTLRDLLSTYEKELEITHKVVQEAEKEVPKSGYDTSKYYTVPVDEKTNDPIVIENITTDMTDTTSDSDTITADILRVTPTTSAYDGYLVQDGIPPNGFPITSGTTFPGDPTIGDFALRLDFLPNRLFRYNGSRWVKVEDSNRAALGPGSGTQLDTFINNTNTYNGTTERQALSSLLEAEED